MLMPAEMGSGLHYSADLWTMGEMLGCLFGFFKRAFAML